VNVFINIERDSNGPKVVVKLLDGFKQLGYIAEVERALYGLRDSPALWYKYWTNTLKSIGLS
jgi:hypothetical protein